MRFQLQFNDELLCREVNCVQNASNVPEGTQNARPFRVFPEEHIDVLVLPTQLNEAMFLKEHFSRLGCAT